MAASSPRKKKITKSNWDGHGSVVFHVEGEALKGPEFTRAASV
jgi:hypothetical protein